MPVPIRKTQALRRSQDRGCGGATSAVTQARAMRGEMVKASELLRREPIASMRDIMVRGDQGEIPARVYTPEGSSLGDPRPILLWFHGGGL